MKDVVRLQNIIHSVQLVKFSRLMQKSSFDKDLTKNIRLFISGSAPLSTVLWEDFKQRTGHEILERYGMTEGYDLFCH